MKKYEAMRLDGLTALSFL